MFTFVARRRFWLTQTLLILPASSSPRLSSPDIILLVLDFYLSRHVQTFWRYAGEIQLPRGRLDKDVFRCKLLTHFSSLSSVKTAIFPDMCENFDGTEVLCVGYEPKGRPMIVTVRVFTSVFVSSCSIYLLPILLGRSHGSFE